MIISEAQALIASSDTDSIKAKLGDMKNITVSAQDGNTLIFAKGIGKHAAYPEGSLNAAKILADALAGLDILKSETREKMKFVSACLDDYNGASVSIPYEDEPSGKLTHVCGLISIQDNKLKLNFNIRYPVTADQDEMIQNFNQHFEKAGFKVVSLNNNKPAYVPKDSEAVKALNKICNDTLDTNFEPYTMGGGTYARKLPNAVGYGPARSDREVPFGEAHQPDECMSIEDLLDALKIYIKAFIALDKII